ncbi:MAG: sodium:solute symporter family protein [Lentisphaerae bacterium]|nr:sodium:solute symporter family protein [Lentisphaerota bacterium]
MGLHRTLDCGDFLCLNSGRGIATLNEYSVCRRSYGSLIIFATLSASFIGGGFSMGNAAKVYAIGIVSVVGLWGFSLKEFFVAMFIAPRVHHLRQCISTGDVMAINYGKSGRIIAGVLGVLVCTGITGAQVGAMGAVFAQFTGVSLLTGILIGCGIVIAYTTAGGMRAVVRTDVVQFVLLGVTIPLTLVLGLRAVGGVAGLRAGVPAGHLALFHGQMTPMMVFSLFLSFMLGETLVPPYLQRLLIGRNSRATAEGTLYSAIFSVPFFAVTGLIGLVALALAPGLEGNAPMPFLVQHVLPVGLRGLAIAGIISIVMSSADSFLNAASVALVNDIVRPLAPRPISERAGLRYARLTTLAVGLGSVWFALSIENVLDILLFSYNFWAPVVLVPLVATMLGVRARQKTFLVGALCGVLALSAWHWILRDPLGIDGLVIGVLANFIAFGAMHQIDRSVGQAEKSCMSAG